jgi:hypothetical protein
MYIFVREDLPHTYQIVQAAHATHHAGIRFGKTDLPTHFVLIGVKNQEAMLAAARFLEFHQIEFEMFHETDNDTGYTAIATKPLVGEERKPMKRFQLMKGAQQ